MYSKHNKQLQSMLYYTVAHAYNSVMYSGMGLPAGYVMYVLLRNIWNRQFRVYETLILNSAKNICFTSCFTVIISITTYLVVCRLAHTITFMLNYISISPEEETP